MRRHIKRHMNIGLGQHIGAVLRPFNQTYIVVQGFQEPQFINFLWLSETIEIGVPNRQHRVIGLHKGKAGARHLHGLAANGANKPARKGGFADPQITMQKNQTWRVKRCGQPARHARTGRFIDTVIGKAFLRHICFYEADRVSAS